MQLFRLEPAALRPASIAVADAAVVWRHLVVNIDNPNG